jgi:sarcosine oxidase, subunit beta
MTTTADAVVIGGGVIGASIAFHLASAGVRDVVVCERRSLGAGASGKTAALVQTHYRTEPDARLGVASLPYFHRWDEIVGAGSPGFVESGFLALVSEHDRPKLEANLAMLRRVGVETWTIGQEQVAEMAPVLRHDDIGLAAYEPRSGYADPLATIAGFLEAARRSGTIVDIGREVTDVRVDGGRVAGVETSRGPISAPLVFLAAGNWAVPLLERLGISVPMLGVRAQLSAFAWSGLAEGPLLPVVIDRISDIYFRADAADRTRLIVGVGTTEPRAVPDPDRLEAGADDDFLAAARARLPSRIPGAVDAVPLGGWSGPVLSTPDRSPIIDRHPGLDGLFVFTGDSGRSFKTSPAIGRALVEWGLDGAPRIVDLRPFRISRFAEGDPIGLQTDYDDHATYYANLDRDMERAGGPRT